MTDLRHATRLSLFSARELTLDERAAIDESLRPGPWAGESSADLRTLTQDETDHLVRREVAMQRRASARALELDTSSVPIEPAAMPRPPVSPPARKPRQRAARRSAR
jgi:hypothetical protein